MSNTKILIVEDDIDINNLLSKIMQKQGYETVQAFSGSEGKLRLSMEEYDMVLLDLMLPGVIGEDLIVDIRKEKDVPIIVLSAKSSLKDRVEVLNLGADDYLVKPFEKEEVVARVNGALRRYKRYASATFSRENVEADICSYKNLSLNTAKREVTLKGTVLNVTAHEFDILELLMRNPGKVFSRESLYEKVWKGGYYGEDNTVNVHISNLRKKMSVVDDTEYISTVWGIGFKFG